MLLVVPWRCRALRSLVHLRLLRRYANSLGLAVALVSRDSTTRVLAREAGFSVFLTVKRGREARWRSLVPDILAPARPPAGEERLSKKRAIPAWLRPRSLARAFLGLVALALLILFLLAMVLAIVPVATITLAPATETLDETLTIQANPEITDVDYEQVQIPARLVERVIEGQAEAPPAARKDVADARASGTVIFINKRGEPSTIPEGTLVSTSAGTVIKFRTVEEVTLPSEGGGRAQVGIMAVDPGPSGNVKAWTINTVEPSLAFLANVVNDAPTSGGSVKQAGVVTAEDKRRLRDSLLQRLQQEAANELQGEVGEDEFLSQESVTVEVVDELFGQRVDELTETLSLHMRVKAEGTVVPLEGSRELALAFLESQVPEGFHLLPESSEIEPGPVTSVEGQRVRFRVRVSGQVVAPVDEDEVRSAVQGKPIVEAAETLAERWKLAAPTIEVSPDWLEQVPWLPFRIRVVTASESGSAD